MPVPALGFKPLEAQPHISGIDVMNKGSASRRWSWRTRGWSEGCRAALAET
jgi:hypothetical protein